MADFAFEDDISCFICKEAVNYGDDYRSHLTVQHNVKYNLSFYLEKAGQEKMHRKNGTKPAEVECVEIDEEEEDLNEKKDAGNEVEELGNEIEEEIQLNDKVKASLEENISKTMNEMFSKIRDMCENGVEIDPNVNLDDFEYDEEEACKDEEKIWESFENLKSIVHNFQLPQELVDDIKDDGKKTTAEMKEITLEELADPEMAEVPWYKKGIYFVCSKCNERFDGRQVFRRHLGKNHGVKMTGPINMKVLKTHASSYDENLEYSCQVCKKTCKFDEMGISSHLRSHSISLAEYGDKYESSKSSSDFKMPPKRKETPITSKPRTTKPKLLTPSPAPSPTPQMTPVMSDKSSSSSTPSSVPTPRLETIYLCPVPYTGTDKEARVSCTFRTSKEGMKQGAAARHLCQDHKIKPGDMKPGQFKFNKIKNEIS